MITDRLDTVGLARCRARMLPRHARRAAGPPSAAAGQTPTGPLPACAPHRAAAVLKLLRVEPCSRDNAIIAMGGDRQATAEAFDWLRGMAANSIDSIVTDPPYGLTANKKGGTGAASINLDSPHGRSRIGTGNGAGGFMGMKWDSDVPSVEVWAECLRVLKPGGHLLAFAGTRTQHRMATRIEDAGFEIRDLVLWVYGSGFPKSRNVAADMQDSSAAAQWKGWGTALKPALEPITMARKAPDGTIAENLLRWGTGALNIDACRIDSGDMPRPFGNPTEAEGWRLHKAPHEWKPSELGRWPANLMHDGSDEARAAFPDAPGQPADISDTAPSEKTSNVYGQMRRSREGEASANSDNHGAVGFSMKPGARRTDTGSAARFFYCPKASNGDRNEGLHGHAKQAAGLSSNTSGQHITRRGEGFAVAPRANHHPTVKPTDLMAYLCRLVTPPGGLVLDPFMGSGSTGKAALLEGFRFIGIEREAEYIAIARARIDDARRQGFQPGLELAA